MKKLIGIALLLPFISFGQKFEISEQIGYGQTSNVLIYDEAIIGLSNQLAFGYHPIKHFSISAFYEFDSWKGDNKSTQTNYNSFGFSPDFTSKYFYTGMNVEMANFRVVRYRFQNGKYNASPGYGLHIGSKQRIYKQLSVLEQIGYDLLSESGKFSNEIPFNETVSKIYFRTGISYGL